MISISRLTKANVLVGWLAVALDEQTLPAHNRARAAASCFGIVQDHHHAIVALLYQPIYAPSFSLLRIQFEAYVRGLWLMYCASEMEIDAFLAGKAPPGVGQLIKMIEEVPAFSCTVLSDIKRKVWNVMCDYTHTGGLHVQRWNTSDAVQPNYSREEVEEVLRLAEIIGVCSAVDFAQLAGNDALADQALDKLRSLVDELSHSH
ncbi:DUF6988 family protein [Cupriavidus basilensis]